jgi:hypothetical protein
VAPAVIVTSGAPPSAVVKTFAVGEATMLGVARVWLGPSPPNATAAMPAATTISGACVCDCARVFPLRPWRFPFGGGPRVTQRAAMGLWS